MADRKKGITETSTAAEGKVKKQSSVKKQGSAKKQGSIRTEPATKLVSSKRVENIPDEFSPTEDNPVKDNPVEDAFVKDTPVKYKLVGDIVCPRCGDVIGPQQPLPHTLTRCNRCGIWIDNQGNRRIPPWRGRQ